MPPPAQFEKDPQVFRGATAANSGSSGLVPKPKAGDQDAFLSADGSWKIPGAVTPGAFATVEYVNGLAPITAINLTQLLQTPSTGVYRVGFVIYEQASDDAAGVWAFDPLSYATEDKYVKLPNDRTIVSAGRWLKTAGMYFAPIVAGNLNGVDGNNMIIRPVAGKIFIKVQGSSPTKYREFLFLTADGIPSPSVSDIELSYAQLPLE